MVILLLLLGLMCIYSYVVYPIILKLIPSRRPVGGGLSQDAPLPSLSLIITVHNEESRIASKLENTLAIDYPGELLDVIVASDFSTDGTEEIVNQYRERGVRLIKADVRKGKEYAQLCAIKEARGDILVFSDVATQIQADGLNRLATYFNDEEVGAISSEDQFVSQDGSVVGEGVYVRYEMWLRRLESGRAGLVGLSGSFFAARKSVCAQWDITVPSDFNTALNCAKLGMVAVTCPDVVGIYKDVADSALEYRRKTRTIIRGLASIMTHREVLNPFQMGLFAFQVWSHKIMRWAVPWFMVAFFVVSYYLATEHWVYLVVLLGQVVFYGLVLLGFVFPRMREKTAVKIPYFFVQVNIAIMQATLQFLAGKRITVWEPSKR